MPSNLTRDAITELLRECPPQTTYAEELRTEQRRRANLAGRVSALVEENRRALLLAEKRRRRRALNA